MQTWRADHPLEHLKLFRPEWPPEAAPCQGHLRDFMMKLSRFHSALRPLKFLIFRLPSSSVCRRGLKWS
eukprot:2552487-Lingulodinium_polyedra.AAC.1